MKTNKFSCFRQPVLRNTLVLMLAIFAMCGNGLMAQVADSTRKQCNYKHTFQISALEVMGRIYSAAYFYEFSPKNNLMLGLAYENMTYDCGTTHAPAILIGYRRFFWKGLNADYAFWPAFNSFYEKNEQKYYKSLELWGELRIGYEYVFKLKKRPVFVAPQFIVGKGLLAGRKPQSFMDYYKYEEPVFLAGNISIGLKF